MGLLRYNAPVRLSAKASACLSFIFFASVGALSLQVKDLEYALAQASESREPRETTSFRSITWDQAAGSGEMPRPPGAGFKRTVLQEGLYEIRYTFQNFNSDKLTVEFIVVQAEIDGSMKEFGYSEKELDDIHKKFGAQGQAVYQQRVQEYFITRGFRVVEKNTVMVDIPQMIRRNLKRVNAMALSLQRVGEENNYDSDDLIGATVAMVQTAMAYKIPPVQDGSRRISGVYPPPKALVNGWGDCDTKSALIGAVLANWSGIRGVGVALPKHYLIGIARIPRQGDVFLEHNGTKYVLIESAGPAWLPPGTVGDDTMAMLERANGVPIQPF